MTVQEMITAIDGVIKDIRETSTQNLGALSMDTVARVSKRVIEKQTNANGSSFGPYSQTKLPAFFYYSTARRIKKGLNEIIALAKEGKLLTYTEFRALLGFSNSSKSFELSGEMWAGYGIVSVNFDTETILIGGRTRGAEQKMIWNSTREGINIIAVSAEEIQKIVEGRDKWIMGLFTKNQLTT